MRKVKTKRGTYRIVGDEEGLYAISISDKEDRFEFKPYATDEQIIDRINETAEGEDLPVGVWLTDFDKAPRNIGLLLYSGEIYEPGWGCISDDDEIISSHSEYDHCPLNHIDQYMIIPNFEP